MDSSRTAILKPAIRKAEARSKVTNGKRLLLDPGGGRSRWARRVRDLIELHVSDLGGELNTSTAERSIIRRAAVLTTELELLEGKFANAGAASAEDLDLYQRTAGNLRRLLEAIGLHRRLREVNPSLVDVLQHREDGP